MSVHFPTRIPHPPKFVPVKPGTSMPSGDDPESPDAVAAADGLAARLRAVFTEANFTEEGISSRLLAKESQSPRKELMLGLYRTRDLDTLSTLCRLFVLETSVTVVEAAEALGSVALSDIVALGLLEIHGRLAVPTVRIRPFRGNWILFDLETLPPFAERVASISGSSRTLLQLTIRRKSRQTLDLGTGNGVQALLAAPHSEKVLATDFNARAVQFALFNARLNGVNNIEGRAGDLFQPVANEQFDLIVCNPPFVMSPEGRFQYRDSGRKGDEFCQSIIHTAPQLLNQGGYCQVLANWAVLENQSMPERLGAWFRGLGCDAWVITSGVEEPARYAFDWITATDDGDDQARRYEEWLAYYESQGIRQIAGGMITLRKRAGENWVWFDEAFPVMGDAGGMSIEMGFALRDFLESLPHEQALLDVPLRIAPHVRLDQELMRENDCWMLVNGQLRQALGVAYQLQADHYVLSLLSACGGGKTLRMLIQEIAEQLREPVEQLQPGALLAARRLVLNGFLLPPTVSDSITLA